MTFDFLGTTALITGASSGLGAEFARQLAPQARALVLVARRLDALEAVRAGLLSLKPGLEVHLVTADLGLEAGRQGVIDWVRAHPEVKVNLLINNAGLGDYGLLEDAPAEKLRLQLEVNIAAVVMLTQAMVQVLAANAPAGILNVSSLASTLPMPDLAVYAASKSFVTSFSEAMTIELKPRGIAVSCVCPGPTPTNFSKTARRADGTDTERSGQGLLRIPPQRVVAEALAALQGGRACVFPGAGVALAGRLFRLMPRGIMRLFLRRRFGKRTV